MIPVFEPEIGEEEIAAVVAALRRGEISGSFGKSITDFEEHFAAFCGRKYGIAVNSGTAALHIAVAAAGIGDGDEVLLSASTNIATALAAYHNRAVSVPVDSEVETWNLNLDLIEPLISQRSRAILPVHLYGHPVDMDRLMEIAQRNKLIVIEDCAESHGATVRGRMTGSFGQMACFSFYANKIITTGEGGMVVTDDAAIAEKLRLLRNLAFSKPRFQHLLPAFNFRMTGFQAAMGLAQLKKIKSIIEAKRRLAATYNRYLKDIPGIQTPAQKDWALNVYWMYAIVVHPQFGLDRDGLIEFLAKSGIETRTFFCPMNQQPFLRSQSGYRDVPCPVADQLWKDGLYLPSAGRLTEREIQQVAETIQKAHESQRRV